MENKKQRLFDAAARLFAKQGYTATSIQQISQEAGVNGAMVSYYFGSKQGLYVAVVHFIIQLLADLPQKYPLSSAEPEEIIRQYVRTISQIHQTHPEFVQILSRELCERSSVLPSFVHEYVQPLFLFLCQTFQKGIDTGVFRDNICPEQAVIILAGAINFAYLTAPIRQEIQLQVPLDEHFSHQILDIFFNGIRR